MVTHRLVPVIFLVSAAVLTGCIPQAMQTGTQPAVADGAVGAEAQVKPKFAAITKSLDNGAVEAGLVFNEEYRQYAEKAISRGVGLMEPIFRLTFDDDLEIGLKADWEATRALHGRLSKKLSLLPFEDTKALGEAELAYFKKRDEIVQQKVAAKVQELTELDAGISTLRGAITSFTKLAKEDNSDSYGVPDAPSGQSGSIMSMLSAAKSQDSSPYATPFYSKVLQSFEKKGPTYLLSPSVSLLQDYADLQVSRVQVEPYRIRADGDWKKVQNAALQVDETKKDKTFAAIARGSFIRTNFGINTAVMSLQGFYSRLLAKVIGDMEMEPVSLSASIISIDFLRSAEVHSGKLSPYRGLGNRLMSGLSGGQDGQLDQILIVTDGKNGGMNEEERAAYIRTRVQNLVTPIDELRFYAPVIPYLGLKSMRSELEKGARDKQVLCGLNACSRQGPAETFAYIQAGLVATDLRALRSTETHVASSAVWNDFLACDAYVLPPVQNSLFFSTQDPLGGVEGMLRGYRMLMCQYGAVRNAAATHKAGTPTRLIDALSGAFDSARTELKLSSGLKTKALD